MLTLPFDNCLCYSGLLVIFVEFEVSVVERIEYPVILSIHILSFTLPLCVVGSPLLSFMF